MIVAVLIFSGTLATLAGFAALVAGVSLSSLAGIYTSGILLLAGLIATGCIIRGRSAERDARYQSEVAAEISALRESALLDKRFGSGSPEALSPVLHRSLLIREEAQDIARREESDLLIQFRG